MSYSEYTYDEWERLSFEQKCEIRNNFWDPFSISIGLQTRRNILSAFKKTYPVISENAIEVGYGYFGHYVGMIYVIVADSKTRVPNSFSDIPVNKGVLISKNEFQNSDEIIVTWKRVGGSNTKFVLKCTKYHTFL